MNRNKFIKILILVNIIYIVLIFFFVVGFLVIIIVFVFKGIEILFLGNEFLMDVFLVGIVIMINNLKIKYKWLYI